MPKFKLNAAKYPNVAVMLGTRLVRAEHVDGEVELSEKAAEALTGLYADFLLPCEPAPAPAPEKAEEAPKEAPPKKAAPKKTPARRRRVAKKAE